MTIPLIQLILLALGVILLLIISMQLLNLSAKLSSNTQTSKKRSKKTEEPKPAAEHSSSSTTQSEPSSTEVRSGSDFERFLREDPLRQSLPKEEQFEAFRKWRVENGLTWSATK